MSDNHQMTILNMLEERRESYTKNLKKLEKHSDGLTSKYYDSSDVPPDIMVEVADTNKKVTEYIELISNINLAIDVIKAELLKH